MQTAPIKRSTCFISLILAVISAASSCSSAANKSADDSADPTTIASADSGTTISVDATATTAVSPDATLPLTSTTFTETATTVVGTLTPARNIPTGWVAGAQPGDPIVLAGPGECDPFYAGLAAGPYTQSRCGVWNASDGQRTWTVTRGVSGYLIAIIWQQTAPNTWVPVLRALETTPGQWDDIAIVTGNTDSGPSDELVSGTHIAGASGKLAVAVIDIRSGTPRVVAVHPTAMHGIALLRSGVGVEVWSAVEGADIPKCCPTFFTQSFLVLIDAAWIVDTRGTVPVGDPSIPVSEF